MVNIQNIVGMAASAAVVLSFMGAVLFGIKKVWVETAKQTWLLGELTKRMDDHTNVVHADMERRIRATELRRRSS